MSWTVKGTLTLHSVCNVGVLGIIEVCESNIRILQKTLKTKLWDMYSLPYTHVIKPIFKPMTGSVSKRKGTKGFPKGI